MTVIDRIEKAEEELRLAKLEIGRLNNSVTSEIEVICRQFDWYKVTHVTIGDNSELSKDTDITIWFAHGISDRIGWNGVAEDIHNLGYHIQSIGTIINSRPEYIVLRKY